MDSRMKKMDLRQVGTIVGLDLYVDMSAMGGDKKYKEQLYQKALKALTNEFCPKSDEE